MQILDQGRPKVFESSSLNADCFLQSVNITLSAVSQETKAIGGVLLACAILFAVNNTALISPSDSVAYINESDAHE
jgi:hypothetical protein